MAAVAGLDQVRTRLIDILYPTAESRDPVLPFLWELDRYLTSDSVVLDVGAGSGVRNPYRMRGRVRRIVGIDADERVKANQLLDEGIPGDIARMPFADSSFDVAFSIYVLEHVEDPTAFVAEVRRVLKPGGHFLALTPNRWHYVSMVSRCSPMSFHQFINRSRGRPEQDTFNTFYRLNSRSQLRRSFASQGFREVSFCAVEVCPSYLAFSTPSLVLGALYERLVNSSCAFAPLRVNLIPTYQKLG